MAFFNTKHFDGKIKIAEVDIKATLSSQVYRLWDSEKKAPWETYHYHLSMTNQKSEEDDVSGFDAKNKVEYHVPYISKTGYRSDFFQYEKKPNDLKMEDVKEMIEGRVKVLLGKNLEFMKTKPVEVVSKIPEKSWEDNDD